MAKSISDYFAMWKIARSLNERYASEIGQEHLADEQFVIQQHAVLMMTKTPATNDEEVRMKLRVATLESEFKLSGPQEHDTVDVQLKIQILKELDTLIAHSELNNRI